MICFPNAKINIGLNITEKRSDGFHNLESVFYPVKWRDALEAIPAERLIFDTTGLDIPGKPENNLILKAFDLIKPFVKKESNVHIHLHKVIPMGAGLGGGSADGAFALKLFNELLECDLSILQLQQMAATLGSDCPFFIENKPVFCFDRGIEFKTIELDLTGYTIVCINPGIHISTAEAYGSITPSKPNEPVITLIEEPIEKWKGLIKNDFEEPLSKKYPLIAELVNRLYQKGAIYAAMTGSGSTVYGIFKEEPDLKNQFSEYAVWKGEL
ncbi:4-(cytidine 5'-diphospho)-2-C-methyl-D-erythritol kinase [Jiulongibacter sediminis]|uniref:4-(cytidine 5'-diphospho)-2-C-methyl-D-erythritol kinase n=1 Tax=Jiulongibacter sediminis TaxID=1605367 RepID=UPI0026F0F1C5|nr:4-(cytidine 5'-diphospho)-2-C-methyl-D-erythritol kinase [Jiulongibacter sediminis]